MLSLAFQFNDTNDTNDTNRISKGLSKLCSYESLSCSFSLILLLPELMNQ